MGLDNRGANPRNVRSLCAFHACPSILGHPAVTSSARPIEQWVEILAALPAPHSAELAVAERVLGDLAGYRQNSRWRADDAEQIAAAMQAYARLCFDAGFRP
jgi:hypothetical protein